MSIETTVLIENISGPAGIQYSEPAKGSGHHYGDGLHTYTYNVNNLIGTIVLEGSLELYPGESDWVTIKGTEFFADISTSVYNSNFVGNFVWIRAKYQIDQGSIQQIRFNY
jgi:hypothetical protein